MKLKNIIAEALDLTGIQGQLVALKKNYDDMNKSIAGNPLLTKEYAPQLTNMSASIAGLEKVLGAMSLQQKTEGALVAKQQLANQQNSAKPGTTTPLSQQATTPSVKPPAPVAPVQQQVR